jgi:actin-related protein 8
VLSEFNSTVKADTLDMMSSLRWTDVSNEPQFLIGEDALMVSPKEPYDLHWPIRRGSFNLHPGVGGTVSAVLQDLEDIWSTALDTYLSIPCTDVKNYRAVLLIPDVYHRRHVRDLLDLLLQRLGFAAAFIVQESVCATFGAGVGSACVVDVGDQKTTVSCVEDGLVQPLTRLVMQYGGCDISRCFHWLLTRCSFPYRECRLAQRMDALFIQDLKETFCHLEQDMQGIEQSEVTLRRPSQRVTKYTVRMGDERILAPMATFFPDLLGLKGDKLFQKPEKFASDPSDPNDDDYLATTMSRHELAARQRKKDTTAVESASQSQDNSMMDDTQMDDDDMIDPTELGQGSGVKGRAEDESDGVDTSHGLVGIHEAILMSIDKCDTDEMKKRMYSCIVVVGGGLMFPGAQSWLQYLVWTNMPASMRLALETMDVITKPKDLDPRMTSWKGASIMSCLDTANELWVTGTEWKRYAVRVLRERIPFVW